MKVLYASSEALPFAASGGLADVAGSLPQALRRRKVACRVVMPLYGTISEEMRANMKFITSIMVPVSWRRQYCGIYEAKAGGVIYYLIDNEYYFKRNTFYGHYDDGERFAFFSRAVLEILPYIDFKPDIIHCNDWQTALVPVYYSTYFANREGYTGIKTVFTIHNIQYQGKYGREILGDVFGLGEEHASLLDFGGCVNLMKGGIECANKVTTVSNTYAGEILDPWFSHGLDPILKERSGKLSGILNGIDVINYDPETDKDIFYNYSAKDYSAKAQNKAALQELFGLPVNADTPVMGIVSRLVAHKGLDLVKRIMWELLETTDLQLAVLGSGDWEYESFFKELAAAFPGKVGLRIGFIPDLARKIYAGCDLFLMPSKSEPCGLSQMVALRYGTVPIVRETGGLKDTITDSGDGKGNGFTFKSYDAYDMLDAIRRSLAAYADKDGWQKLVERALKCDNSWGRSAREYIKLYEELM
ncbi:MAG: glycogen synthase GlgA [Acutalibacteraceae bacterium]|nr:glycogen synthase GlgA [Acutalibacteraceae bacterium]